MKISFNKEEWTFDVWKPSLGRVFSQNLAFDCETTKIDEERPWLIPAYVLGAAVDGKQGYFVQRKDVGAFFQVHKDSRIIFHNASFDLAVIHALASEIDIYSRVDEDLVWDTQLLHRLYVLGTEGHTA